MNGVAIIVVSVETCYEETPIARQETRHMGDLYMCNRRLGRIVYERYGAVRTEGKVRGKVRSAQSMMRNDEVGPEEFQSGDNLGSYRIRIAPTVSAKRAGASDAASANSTPQLQPWKL